MNPNPNQPQVQQQNTPVQSNGPKLKPKIGTLVVAAVIGLLLGVALGFYLGASTQKSNDNAKIVELNLENTRLAKQVEVLSIDPSSKTGAFSYLDITEWKVRMPLNDKFTDVVYRIKTSEGKSFVEISSAKLAKISTCDNYNGMIGTIYKAEAGTTPETGKVVTGFDGQIYMYQQFDKTCTSDPKGTEAPYKASVLEQFAKLEPIPTKRITSPNSSVQE